MEQMMLQDVLIATGGKLLSDSDPATAITGVDTDSRKMGEGTLFIPLVGERFDGHDYINAALDSGAAGTLTAQTPEHFRPGRFYVLVEDTQRALRELAIHYRKKFPIPVVAVTGSVGKTTTKDMVASVLSEKFCVLKTEGNFNNNIGLPLTVFRLTSRHEIAVLEMGMNHPGEIDYLTTIACPTVALITNIGDAHIENLGSRENTLKAKSEIFHGMDGKGIAVLNGDDALLRTLEGRISQKILWCGGAYENEYRAENLRDVEDNCMLAELICQGESWTQEIPGLGSHMIYPVLMAAAVGRYFGMTREEIDAGITHFVPTKMRMAMLGRSGDSVILDDTYNANPQSMRAAVEVLSKRKNARKIAVLGDMLELGELGAELHRGVGEYVSGCDVDILITVGELAREICAAASERGMEQVYPFDTREEAAQLLRRLAGPDTAVLCKASRGMHFEYLVDELKKILPEEEK